MADQVNFALLGLGFPELSNDTNGSEPKLAAKTYKMRHSFRENELRKT